MNICIYGASSNEIDRSYIMAVEELGRELARRDHGLVYGGGAQGLMGAAARGVLECGGKIIGVAPSFFNVDGVLFQQCTEFFTTETMRERKQIMEDRADAFIMVPGGIGTFEEFFEILTLKQLGRHNKAIAVFNINGYYDDINELMQKAIDQFFMKPACKTLYEFFTDATAILDYIESYKPADIGVEKLKNI